MSKSMNLTVWEPSGVNRMGWPVTVGVPFPKGVFLKEDNARLYDGTYEIPLSLHITSRWEDNSIRWALLDFQMDIKGNEKKSLRLDYGVGESKKASFDPKLIIVQDEGSIVVENGTYSLVFKKGGRMPFENIYRDDTALFLKEEGHFSISENNSLYMAEAECIKVECECMHRITVRCDGKFKNNEGMLMDITSRAYIYAGKPFVKIYHTIENKEKRDVYIDSLTVNFKPVGNGTKQYVTGIGVDDSLYEAQGNSAAIQVDTEPIPETKYDKNVLRPFVKFGDRLDEIDGTMEHKAGKAILKLGDGTEREIQKEAFMFPYTASASNYTGTDRTLLYIRNFYKQAPKRIHADNNSLGCDLYWNFNGKPLQFWRGTAKTHEMYLLFDQEKAPESTEEILKYKRLLLAFEEPMMPLYGEESWFQKSGVFGPIFNYSPEKYPWTEFLFRTIFETWISHDANSDIGTTFMDFGDCWGPKRGGQWQNNEMDFGGATLINMFRTGYPKYFYDAEKRIHHQMDIDTHHEHADEIAIGSQRYHQVRHGAFSGPQLCHQWLEGPLLYYFYTGYERGKEVALMRAKHFMRSIEQGRHRMKTLERLQGWPLVALSTINWYFPDKRYEKACTMIMDWLEEWLKADGDLTYPYIWETGEGETGVSILGRGVIGQALAHYHRITGLERAFNILSTVMELAKKKLFSNEGLGTKTSLLRRNYYAPGESDFIIEPLAYMWEKTGDKEWMRLALLNYKLAVIQRNPLSGSVGRLTEPYRYWTPFLYYADKSGMLEDISIL